MKRIVPADSKKLKMELLRFYIEQYRNHPMKRDSLSGLLKGILFESSELSKAVDSYPLMVKDEDNIILIAVLAHVNRMDEYLQISFFESPQQDMEAFELLMEHAVSLAREYGCKKICASLNLHVNYGLGFLYDSYDKPQSFGMAHNPPHIHDYFENNGFERIEMVTFKKDMESLGDFMSSNLKRRIRDKYTVRTVVLSKLEEEAAIYSRINNDAFKDHLFYYRRVPKEDLELFKDFKFLLKDENLLFVQKDGVDVGFMLWYPDFHQIMDSKDSMGLRTVIRNRFMGNKIDTFKIVEMGVVPCEQEKGAILALFDYCHTVTRGRYRYFESGWVLKDNLRSRAFGDKWSDGVSKTYAAYVKELL